MNKYDRDRDDFEKYYSKKNRKSTLIRREQHAAFHKKHRYENED